MTAQQKAWLDGHPGYRALHAPGGGSRFVNVGLLHPDGTFEAKRTRTPGYSHLVPDSFEVGVLIMPLQPPHGG